MTEIIDYSRQNIEGDFKGKENKKYNFKGTKFNKIISFSGYFNGLDLSESDFTNCTAINFFAVDLTDANLSGLDFTKTNLYFSSANITNLDTRKTKFRSATFYNCYYYLNGEKKKFTEDDFNIFFNKTQFNVKNTIVKINGIVTLMMLSDLKPATDNIIDYSNQTFNDKTLFDGKDDNTYNFENTHFKSAIKFTNNFKGLDLSKADFKDCPKIFFDSVNLTDANLSGLDFSNTNLYFSGANLTHFKFSKKIKYAKFSNCFTVDSNSNKIEFYKYKTQLESYFKKNVEINDNKDVIIRSLFKGGKPTKRKPKRNPTKKPKRKQQKKTQSKNTTKPKKQTYKRPCRAYY